MAITNDFFTALNDPKAAMWSAGVAFNRSNPLPLDKWSVFQTMDEAVAYAESNAVAYPGQLIAVYDAEAGKMTAYILQEVTVDETTKLSPVAVGTTPVGDESTIVVAEDGTVSLAGIAGLVFTETNDEGEEVSVTYQPLLTGNGLTWVRPSATTVEGLATEIEGLKTRMSAAETAISNVYTKAEVDAKFAPVGDYATKEEAQGYADAKDEDIATAKKAGDDAQASVDALAEKVGEVAEGKTVVGMIADAQAAATYDDTQIKADIKANADAIAVIEADYLKSSDKTELSEAISAAEENAVDRVLGYLAEEEVNASYDTLKEVAAWIESDTTASAELVTRVSNIEKNYLKGTDKTELEGEIDALGAYVGDLPEGAASATVIAYIQEVVEALKIGDYAKLSELNALAERVTTLEGKSHEHENADVLGGITAEKVSAWDSAEQNAKDYADGLNIAMGTRVGEVETALEGKVGVEEGKSLISDTLIAKLEGISEGAQVNVIDTVDEAQFALTNKHLTLLDIAMGKVTGLQDALDTKANKGTTLAEYGIANAYTKTETEARIQDVLDGLSDTSETAASVAQALETYKTSNNQRVDTIEGKLAGIAEGAQVNVLEGVKVGGTLLEIADKVVNIPVATSTLLGVVMSSTTENKVAVAEDGTMEVNSLNVNKLVQSAGDTLVLDGGASA